MKLTTEQLLEKLEFACEDGTCEEQRGHWYLYSTTEKPFDSYSNDKYPEDCYERFRKAYKLPKGYLKLLTDAGYLEKYYLDDGTMHFHFSENCRLGGLFEE